MDSFKIEQLFLKFRYPLLILVMGLILTGFGIFIIRNGILGQKTEVEVLQGTTESQGPGYITAEISGAVIGPGVFRLKEGSRINDLLAAAGGFSGNADRSWTEKYLNRAAVVTDGQKVYVPEVDKQKSVMSAKTNGGNQTISAENQSDSNGLININTASLEQLDTLPGIGQVYGQNIIEHRPYSNTEELVKNGAIKQSLFEKIKDKITVY